MTPSQLALRVLKYSGITSFNPADDAALNGRGLVTGDIDDLLACMNGANQELCALAPAALTELAFSTALRPPAVLSATVSQYSTAITLPGWQDWMESCTIRLDGDMTDNRIESATTLRSPYMGTSTTVSATVYADAVLLPAYTLNAIEPIYVDSRQLSVAKDAASFQRYPGTYSTTYGDSVYNTPEQMGYGYGSWDGTNKPVGTPCVAYVDSLWNATRPYLSKYLRVSPAPDRAYVLRCRLKREPKPFSQSDITTTVNGNPYADPGTIIPEAWIESILLPFTLQRWTSHPSFVGTQAQAQEIARQYSAARALVSAQVPILNSQRAKFI